MAGNQGLSADSNMSEADRKKVHKMGGEASGGTNSRSTSTGKNDVITNSSGGGALDKDDLRKGGHNSHKND